MHKEIQLKLVAEFDGYKLIQDGKQYWRDIDKALFFERELQYHCSWDWQIPVLQKLITQSKSFKISERYTTTIDKEKFLELYSRCIAKNSPEEGFKLLALNIEHYNKNK